MTRLPRLPAAALAAATLAGLAPAAAAAAPAYTSVPGPYRAHARFRVSYQGIGFFHTTFHAHPPNPGGADDVNGARDSSGQAWSIRFRGALDAASPADLNGALGATTATGEVRHVHVDGLYPAFDQTLTCRLVKRTTARTAVMARIGVRPVAGGRGVAVTARDPVASVLALFPPQCPGQGDSIERMLDFYAPPGFSFASGYGADRWFTSRAVTIPAAALHRSARIDIRLADTPAGAPPRDCVVLDPAFERCSTGGSWSGVLTLTALSSGP